MTYIANRRVHVGPHDWDNAGATDYWLMINAAANQVAAASATNPGGLSGWFWTTTSLLVNAGGTGDLNAVGDLDPANIRHDAAADLLRSTRFFGGYDNFQRAAALLKYTPTKLCVEFYAAFITNSANETTTYIGLGIGTDATAAGHAGGIRSGGTASTFFLTSDNGSDAGAAIDAAWHRFRIDFGPTTTEWFVDGVSQGTITTEADIWPQPFTMIAGTTNRIALSWLHIWYE